VFAGSEEEVGPSMAGESGNKNDNGREYGKGKGGARMGEGFTTQTDPLDPA